MERRGQGAEENKGKPTGYETRTKIFGLKDVCLCREPCPSPHPSLGLLACIFPCPYPYTVSCSLHFILMVAAQSDSWAFGIVLWELITFAKMPYAGLSNLVRVVHGTAAVSLVAVAIPKHSGTIVYPTSYFHFGVLCTLTLTCTHLHAFARAHFIHTQEVVERVAEQNYRLPQPKGIRHGTQFVDLCFFTCDRCDALHSPPTDCCNGFLYLFTLTTIGRFSFLHRHVRHDHPLSF